MDDLLNKLICVAFLFQNKCPEGIIHPLTDDRDLPTSQYSQADQLTVDKAPSALNQQKDDLAENPDPSTLYSQRDIAADYIFGHEALRTNRRSTGCKDAVFQAMCHVRCGGNHFCLDGGCYCLEMALDENGESMELDNKESSELPEKDSGEVSEYESEEENIPIPSKYLYGKKTMTSMKPLTLESFALRHQIAHFCPNLDIARACITKCMDQGKPAFCGKDHVCYCGHRDAYTLSSGKQLNAYKQYKDMYEKYFG